MGASRHSMEEPSRAARYPMFLLTEHICESGSEVISALALHLRGLFLRRLSQGAIVCTFGLCCRLWCYCLVEDLLYGSQCTMLLSTGPGPGWCL